MKRVKEFCAETRWGQTGSFPPVCAWTRGTLFALTLAALCSWFVVGSQWDTGSNTRSFWLVCAGIRGTQVSYSTRSDL